MADSHYLLFKRHFWRQNRNAVGSKIFAWTNIHLNHMPAYDNQTVGWSLWKLKLVDWLTSGLHGQCCHRFDPYTPYEQNIDLIWEISTSRFHFFARIIADWRHWWLGSLCASSNVIINMAYNEPLNSHLAWNQNFVIVLETSYASRNKTVHW